MAIKRSEFCRAYASAIEGSEDSITYDCKTHGKCDVCPLRMWLKVNAMADWDGGITAKAAMEILMKQRVSREEAEKIMREKFGIPLDVIQRILREHEDENA